MPEEPKVQSDAPDRRRGKYLTLLVLVVWVLGVFGYTMYRFAGMSK